MEYLKESHKYSKLIDKIIKKIYLSRWFIVLIILIGTAARLRQYLSNRSLWSDEAALALNIIKHGYLDLFKPLDYSQVAPSFFLITVNFLTEIFGYSEYVLRLVPLAASIISLFLLWYLSKKLLDKYMVPIVVGLLSFGGTAIYYSDELKQYSLDLMITIIILILAFNVYKNNFDLKSNLLFGITGSIIVWFSQPSIFALSAVTLSLFLSVIIKEKFKSIKKLFYIIYAALIWGLSFIAGYLFIVRATAHSGFYTFWAHSFAPIPIRSIDNLLWYSETLFSTIRIPISIYFPGIVILLLFAGFIGFFKKKDKILFFSILFTFIFLLAASMLKAYPIHERFILFTLPIFYLMIARGLEELSVNINKKNVIIIIFLVLLIFIQPIGSTARTFFQPKLRTETRPLVEHILNNKSDSDIVYVYYTSKSPFLYYTRDEEIEYILGVESTGNPEKYIDELESLAGKGRVWFIFGPVYGNELDIYLNKLNEMGQRLQYKEAFGASLFLYEI